MHVYRGGQPSPSYGNRQFFAGPLLGGFLGGILGGGLVTGLNRPRPVPYYPAPYPYYPFSSYGPSQFYGSITGVNFPSYPYGTYGSLQW